MIEIILQAIDGRIVLLGLMLLCVAGAVVLLMQERRR